MDSILKSARRYLLEFLEWNRATYVLVAAGLVLRVLALSLVAHVPLRNEAPGYMQMAANLLHHQSFEPYWPPGVPYYLFFAQKIFGESLLVARASILPIYAAFTACLFLFVKRVAALRAANLAALVFVFYPVYVRNSFNPSTEYPAAACLIGTVLLTTLTGRKPALRWGALTGLVLGALILARPSSALVAGFVSFFLFKQSRSLRIALTPLLVAALLVSAWLWRAYAMTGRFVAINDSNSLDFFWGNNPYTPLYATWGDAQGQLGLPDGYRSLLAEIEREPPLVREHLYRHLALRYIVTNPGLFALRTFNRTRAYFGFPVHYAEPFKNILSNRARTLAKVAITVVDGAFYWTVLASAVIFLFNCHDSSLAPDDRLALLGTATAYALPYWVSMSQPRFNFPVVPLLAVLGVVLADSLLRRPASQVLHPVITSPRRRYAMMLVLAAFAYVQIEWTYVAYFCLGG